MKKSRERGYANMKTILMALCLSVIVCVLPARASETPAKKQDHPIALVGGTIHTVSGSVIETGTLLFDKGKLPAIGANVRPGAGAEKIDIRGKHVYPGLIDARSAIGLFEVAVVRASRGVKETGSVNP